MITGAGLVDLVASSIVIRGVVLLVAPKCIEAAAGTTTVATPMSGGGPGPSRPDPGYAAVCLDFAETLRFEDLLRRRPRWRVDVSYGRWLEAGLSCSAHQSVLLYLESRTRHSGSTQIRPAS